MNHIEFEATGAVERYLAGEMNEAEQMEFEEHYFECSACAEEVRIQTIFIANLEAVLHEPYPVSRETARDFAPAPARPAAVRPHWPIVAAMAAALVLAAGIGYQNLVQFPQMRRDLALANAEDSPPTFYLAETRSDSDTLAVPPGTRHISIMLNQTPGRIFAFYECTLQDDRGKTLRAFRVRGPGNQEEWQIRLSTEGLSAQSYTLKVRGESTATGANLEPVAEYHFRLEYR